MDLLGQREYSNVQVKKDGRGFVSGVSSIIPIFDTPIVHDLVGGVSYVDTRGVVPLSGWPLYNIFPNILYNTRYHLDTNMLEEDLAVTDAYIYFPTNIVVNNLERFYSTVFNFNFSNLILSYDIGVPRCFINIESNYTSQLFNNIETVKHTSYYEYDNGVALTDPTTVLITNHHAIKYSALDRGYGRMKHGWFWAEVSGSWTFSVDGLDAVEIVVDEGVVASKYTNSALAGTNVLNGTINLVTGWHHLFAYCSDNSTSTHPVIAFKKPGDVNYTAFTTDATDGIMWNRSSVHPKRTKLRLNAGNITATIEYNDTNTSSLTFSKDTLVSGNFSVSLDTLPRYKPYYLNSWRETQLAVYDTPHTLPPTFKNMRMIMEYHPLAELLCYTSFSKFEDYTPKFAVSFVGSSDWYTWNGSAFVITDVGSVLKLLSFGNSLYEINSVTPAQWTAFLPTTGKTYARLLFTGEPPLAATYSRKVFSGMTYAEYLISTVSHVTGKANIERRQI